MVKSKDVQKLSRKELLGILVGQARQIEQLEAELGEARAELQRRELICQNAGTMAEAALKLNRIFEDADAACQQYFDSLKAQVARRMEALDRLEKGEMALNSPDEERRRSHERQTQADGG